MIDPELKFRIKKVCEKLSYERIFKYFGYSWLSNDEHQLSCPFHAKRVDASGSPLENNPSARYYAKDKSFYCFACAMGGDVVWFVKQHQNFKNIEVTLAWIESTFNLTIDLPSLEDLKNNNVEDRLPLLSKYYNDQMNDFLYVLKRDPDYFPLIIELTPVIFRNKWQLDDKLKKLPYTEAAKRYRDWREQSVKNIMYNIDNIRVSRRAASPV